MLEVEPIRSALSAWYHHHARDLPWRRSRDPYAVWISEVMLQQTTVAAVVPYWERFLRELPDVGALAAAGEQQVLGLWSGLGYYRRARHLHAAARRIVAGGGALPSDLAGWRALPGIGAYTAAAIASIAFGVPEPVVDGNVQRVVARLAAFEGDPKRATGARRIAEIARGLLDRERPGDSNQAVMELGATVCTPRSPACATCPVAAWCGALRTGNPERYPPKAPRRDAVDVVRAAALIEDRRGRCLLAQVPEREVNAGLWELPGATLYHGARDPGRAPRGWSPALGTRFIDALAAEFSLAVTLAAPAGRVAHAITHHRITIYAWHARAHRVPRALNLRYFGQDELDGAALTGATRKILRAARPGGARARTTRPIPGQETFRSASPKRGSGRGRGGRDPRRP